MDGDRLRLTALGFLAAVAVLAGLLYLVGVEELLAQLSRADPRTVGLVVLVTLGWLAAWGLALRTVLSVLGVDIPVHRAFLVFAGAMFSNNITPFGQAGGEPVTALLISGSTDAEYETGLAAIASVDTLNFVPSVTLALFGAAYYATEVTFSRNLRVATGVLVALAVVIPGVVYYGWQNRRRLERRVVAAIVPVIRRVAGVLPGVGAPERAAVEGRIEGFFEAIERIATTPRGLALALGFSALGWLFQMLGLWLAFDAIGVAVPLSAMLFIVPMGAVAGITPLPGGAGGIESVLVVLLVAAPLAGVTESAALAAVVIYRGAVYWTPAVVGGLYTSAVGVGVGLGRG